MAQAIIQHTERLPQQIAARLRIGATLLCAIITFQALASVAIAGSIWP
jgi:hypothetical protein